MSDLNERKRLGISLQGIGAITGHDRKTIRKYLGKEPGMVPSYGPRATRPSKLDPYKPHGGAVEGGRVDPVVLLRELRERGYTGVTPGGLRRGFFTAA